jgi:hypothetical protein
MNVLTFPTFAAAAQDFLKSLATLQQRGFSRLIRVLQVDSRSEYLLSILSDTQRFPGHSGNSRNREVEVAEFGHGSRLNPIDSRKTESSDWQKVSHSMTVKCRTH